MSTRQIVGVGLGSFLLFVSSLHAVELEFTWYDVVYMALSVPSFVSAFIPTKITDYTQILTMLSGAAFISLVDDNSRYVSLLIIAFAYIGATSYGLFIAHRLLKNVVWYILVVTLFVYVCNFNMSEILRWCALVTLCHALTWAFIKDIEKDAILVQSMRAEKAEREREAYRATLVETVEAGMILSEEIKTRGANNAAKG